MKVIGLVGKKRAGKTTAAEVLVRERGFVSIGFADALKDLALRVDPIVTASEYWDEEHKAGTFRLSDYVGTPGGWEFAKSLPEVRRFLQELGTGVRDIVGEYAWTDAWDRALTAGRHFPPPVVVVPDVRFLSEAEAIRTDMRAQGNSLLIRIDRPTVDDGDQHVSETELERIECDATIRNVHSRLWFEDNVLDLVDHWLTTGSVDPEQGIGGDEHGSPPEEG